MTVRHEHLSNPEITKYYVKARIRIENDEEFVQDIILDRDASEYSDPYIPQFAHAHADINPDILYRYLSRVQTAVHNYTPNSNREQKLIEQFYRKEQARINTTLGKLTHPKPIQNVPTFASLSNSFSAQHDVLEDLWTADIQTLRELSASTLVHEQSFSSRNDLYQELPSNTRLLNAIRYVRGDPTVSLDNILVFEPTSSAKQMLSVADADGNKIEITDADITFDEIRTTLNELITTYDTPFTAFALAIIGTITTITYPGISDGEYSWKGTNITTDELNDTSSAFCRGVIEHEFFHAMQHTLDIMDLATSKAVDTGASPDDWLPIIYPDSHPAITSLQKTIKQQWLLLRTGNLDPLVGYQAKNPDELTTVAFEVYHDNPEHLQEQQPKVYDVIDTIMTATTLDDLNIDC